MKLMLFSFILFSNAYFLFFWFKGFIKQKVKELRKRKLPMKLFGYCIERIAKMKKFVKNQDNIFDFDLERVRKAKLEIEKNRQKNSDI